MHFEMARRRSGMSIETKMAIPIWVRLMRYEAPMSQSVMMWWTDGEAEFSGFGLEQSGKGVY